MSFGNAIRSGFHKYVDFSGRASRSEYWWWVLFHLLVGIAAIGLDAILFPRASGSPPYLGVLSAVVTLALFLPSLAVLVRRLHDTDRSGWWYLIAFIPLIGGIALLVFLASSGTPGTNRFGPPPRGSGSFSDYELQRM